MQNKTATNLCKLLGNNKPYLHLFIFAILATGSAIATGFLAPSFWSYWLNNCYDNRYNLIDGCQPDYVRYNLISNIAASISGFVIFSTASLMGNLSDVFGRRYFVGYAILIYLLQRINILITTNIWVYYVYYCFFLGITQCVITSYAGDILSTDDKNIGFGGFGAAIGIGFVLGSIFVIAISTVFNNYTVFIALAILSFIMIIYWYIYLKESLSLEKRKQFKCTTKTFNPYYPLFSICYSNNKFILYCAMVDFLVGFDIAAIQGTLFPFMGDQFSDVLIDESTTNTFFGIVGLLAGFGGLLSNTLILHFMNKRGLSNVQILFFGHSCVIIGLLLLGLVPYIHGLILIPIASFIIGFGVIARASLDALASKCLKENEQGIGFGILESYRSIASILGPGAFGAIYHYFNKYTSTPSMHWFIVALTRIIAVLITIFPLRKAVNDIELSKEEVKSKDDEDAQDNALIMTATYTHVNTDGMETIQT